MGMTIDEAIRHAEEVGKGCNECATEHRQLAEWLNDYKVVKEKLDKIDQLINHWTDYRKGQIEGYGGNEYLRKIQEVLGDEQRRST